MIPNNSYIGLEGRSALGNVRNNEASVVSLNYAMFDGTSGKIIKDSGIPAGGGGGITGPGTTIVNNIATWNSTDGTVLKDSLLPAYIASNYSTFIGRSLRIPSSGDQNTHIGTQQCGASYAGSGNTLIGNFNATNASSISNNTVVGSTAGSSLSTGDDNSFVGKGAGYGAGVNFIQAGSLNTCLGTDSGSSLSTVVGSSCLGWLSTITKNYQIMLGGATTEEVVPNATTISHLGTQANPWSIYQPKLWTLSILPNPQNKLGAQVFLNDTIGGAPVSVPLYSDGVNWKSIVSGGTQWKTFTFVGGTTAAWSNNGTTNYSGITEPHTSETLAFCYNDTKGTDRIEYLSGGTGTNTLAVSTDGKNWTGLGTSVFSSACYGIAISPEGYYCASGDTGVAFTQNPSGWNPRPGLFTTVSIDIAHNGLSAGSGGMFLVGGIGGASSAKYSTNQGDTWTDSPGVGTLINGVWATAYGNGRWMIGGTAVGTDSLAWSGNPAVGFNGLGKTVFNSVVYGICYAPSLDRWLAVGVNAGVGKIAYSDDQGNTWTTSTGMTMTVSQSCCWDGTKFIVLGTGTNTLGYSSLGAVFTPIAGVVSGGPTVGVCGTNNRLPWV